MEQGALVEIAVVEREPATTTECPRRPSDVDLMRSIADGDRDAFGDLFGRHAPAALGLARRILRQPSLAEEAVQEAFLAVWRQPTRYLPGRGSVRTWLISMVHHRAVDLVRREESQRARAHAFASGTAANDRISEPFEDVLLRTVSATEHERMVRAALHGLPPAQHQVIALMYFDGLTQTQISERLSLPLGTVKSRSLLGLRKLRSTLATIER